MAFDIKTWKTSKRRLTVFMQFQLKMEPFSLSWFQDSCPEFYNQFKGAFVGLEGFEQAGIMHEKEQWDGKFIAYFSIYKLNGNPLVMVNKHIYNSDDILMVCWKLGFDFDEAISYCTEDAVSQMEFDGQFNKGGEMPSNDHLQEHTSNHKKA